VEFDKASKLSLQHVVSVKWEERVLDTPTITADTPEASFAAQSQMSKSSKDFLADMRGTQEQKKASAPSETPPMSKPALTTARGTDVDNSSTGGTGRVALEIDRGAGTFVFEIQGA
jgi:hypothetical protein